MNYLLEEIKKNSGVVEKHPKDEKYNRTKRRSGFFFKTGDVIHVLKKTNKLKYSLIQPERLSKKKNGIVNFVPGDKLKIKSLHSQTGSDETVVYDLKVMKVKNTQHEQDGSKVKSSNMRVDFRDLRRWIDEGVIEVKRNNKTISQKGLTAKSSSWLDTVK